MTSIKPPSGPHDGPPPLEPGDGPRTDAPGFRERLEGDGIDSPAAAGVPSPAPEALTEVLSQLHAGAIDRETAIDRVVAHMMEGPSASVLGSRGRTELEAVLRQRLAEDPALRSLLDGLG
ncbi:MAG: hypothetical protein KC416_05485 [Myxococcales bacterium]|nr:hypothetical protein [Myxococcales bacterium]